MKQPMVIAVDVDGTLEVDGVLNDRAIEYLRDMKSKGWTLMLWSSQGQIHAAGFAEQHGISDLFEWIISKPGMNLDDRGWSWTIYCPCITGIIEIREYKNKPKDAS